MTSTITPFLMFQVEGAAAPTLITHELTSAALLDLPGAAD